MEDDKKMKEKNMLKNKRKREPIKIKKSKFKNGK